MNDEDVNFYDEINISTREEVLELSKALATLNTLKDNDEISYSDDLIKPDQLSIILEVLRSISPDISDETNIQDIYDNINKS